LRLAVRPVATSHDETREGLLPDGTLLFEMEADGAWTITLQ